MSVQDFFTWSPVVGSIIAFAVCLRANYLNRRDGLEPEAPSMITGAAVVPALLLLVLLISQSGLWAATANDPCSTISGDNSWTAWFIRITTGC